MTNDTDVINNNNNNNNSNDNNYCCTFQYTVIQSALQNKMKLCMQLRQKYE